MHGGGLSESFNRKDRRMLFISGFMNPRELTASVTATANALACRLINCKNQQRLFIAPCGNNDKKAEVQDGSIKSCFNFIVVCGGVIHYRKNYGT